MNLMKRTTLHITTRAALVSALLVMGCTEHAPAPASGTPDTAVTAQGPALAEQANWTGSWSRDVWANGAAL